MPRLLALGRILVLLLLLAAQVGHATGVSVAQLQSLGCYEPFSVVGTSYTSTSQVSLQSCLQSLNCDGLQLLVRGGQCVCVPSGSSVTRIDDSFCSLECDDDDDQRRVCGGNLGGSLYCYDDNCDQAEPPAPQAIYPSLHLSGDQFLGCGEPAAQPQSIFHYFPVLVAEDCATYCAHISHNYTFLGWKNDGI